MPAELRPQSKRKLAMKVKPEIKKMKKAEQVAKKLEVLEEKEKNEKEEDEKSNKGDGESDQEGDDVRLKITDKWIFNLINSFRRKWRQTTPSLTTKRTITTTTSIMETDSWTKMII